MGDQTTTTQAPIRLNLKNQIPPPPGIRGTHHKTYLHNYTSLILLSPIESPPHPLPFILYSFCRNAQAFCNNAADVNSNCRNIVKHDVILQTYVDCTKKVSDIKYLANLSIATLMLHFD